MLCKIKITTDITIPNVAQDNHKSDYKVICGKIYSHFSNILYITSKIKDRECVYTYTQIRIYMYISPRDIRSATETGVLVTWPNIIDLPIRYICRTSSLTEPPACDSGEDMLRTYIYAETCLPYVHMYTALAAFPPTREFNTSKPLDSWILDDCISRGKSLALSPNEG